MQGPTPLKAKIYSKPAQATRDFQPQESGLYYMPQPIVVSIFFSIPFFHYPNITPIQPQHVPYYNIVHYPNITPIQPLYVPYYTIVHYLNITPIQPLDIPHYNIVHYPNITPLQPPFIPYYNIVVSIFFSILSLNPKPTKKIAQVQCAPSRTAMTWLSKLSRRMPRKRRPGVKNLHLLGFEFRV